MLKHIFAVVLLSISCLSVSAQFPVKLELSATDDELEEAFRTAMTAEIKRIPDIRLADKGKFGLLVQLIRRAGSGTDGDIFVSAVATSESVCILEQEASGRVVSRQTCREFLTSNTYIGRLDETGKLAADIVTSFNDYVLEPLREIGKP